MMLATLYVGTSEASWLERTEVPLFIPYHRLLRRKGPLPRSPRNGHWALDSGGYNHIRKYGCWAIPPEQYVADTLRFDREIGNLGWAAPMDMMCEVDAFTATGLSELAHQQFTVTNFVQLERLWYDQSDSESPFMPVLQADPDLPVDDMVASYLRCWGMYAEAGVDLGYRTLVGLGSICRQQATEKIGALVTALHEHDSRDETVEPLPLHGFGCKTLGLLRYGHLMTSADSQAWSARQRYASRRNEPKWAGCPMDHPDCRNCFHWALEWRRRALARVSVYDAHNVEGIGQIEWAHAVQTPSYSDSTP